MIDRNDPSLLVNDPVTSATYLRPQPDEGSAQAFVDSFALAAESTVGWQGWTYTADRLRDLNARLNDEAPVSKEEFDQKFSLGGRLKHYEGMSRGTAMDLFRRTLEQDFRGRRLSVGDHWVSSLVGGFAGGMFADPVTAAVSVLAPETQVARFSRGATIAARANRGLRVLDNTINAAVSGARDAYLTELPNLYLSQQNQANYGYSEFFMNLTASTAMGGLIRMGTSTGKAVLRPDLDQAIADIALKMTMDGKQAAEAINATAGVTPDVKAAAEAAQKAVDDTGKKTEEAAETTHDHNEDAASTPFTPEKKAQALAEIKKVLEGEGSRWKSSTLSPERQRLLDSELDRLLSDPGKNLEALDKIVDAKFASIGRGMSLLQSLDEYAARGVDGPEIAELHEILRAVTAVEGKHLRRIKETLGYLPKTKERAKLELIMDKGVRRNDNPRYPDAPEKVHAILQRYRADPDTFTPSRNELALLSTYINDFDVYQDAFRELIGLQALIMGDKAGSPADLARKDFALQKMKEFILLDRDARARHVAEVLDLLITAREDYRVKEGLVSADGQDRYDPLVSYADKDALNRLQDEILDGEKQDQEGDPFMRWGVTSRPVTDADRLSNAAKNRVIRQKIMADPETRSVARNSDEAFLQNAWKKLFGVDVKFIGQKIADTYGVAGFVNKTDPNTIYVRAGSFENQLPGRSMVYIAGHELAHTIRFRDVAMWNDVTKAMLSLSNDATFTQAYREFITYRNKNGGWLHTATEGKIDEVFANVLGKAMTYSQFWSSLASGNPKNASKLLTWVSDMAGKFGTWRGNTDRQAPSASKNLYEALGEILSAANEAGVPRLAERVGLDPKSVSLRELYAPIRQTARERLNRAAQAFGNEELQKALQMEEAIADMVSMDEGIYSDISGGKYGDRLVKELDPVRLEPGRSPESYILSVIMRFIEKSPTARAFADDYFEGKLGAMPAARALDNPVFPLVVGRRLDDGRYQFAIVKNDNFPKWYQGMDQLPDPKRLAVEEFVSEHFTRLAKQYDIIWSREAELREVHDDVENKADPETAEAQAKEIERKAAWAEKLLFDNPYFARYWDSLEAADVELINTDPSTFWSGYRQWLSAELNKALNDMPEASRADMTKAYREYRKWAEARAKQTGKQVSPFDTREATVQGKTETVVATPTFGTWVRDILRNEKIVPMAELFDDVDRIEMVTNAFDGDRPVPKDWETALKQARPEMEKVIKETAGVYGEALRLLNASLREMPNLDRGPDPLGYSPDDPRNPYFIGPRVTNEGLLEKYRAEVAMVRQRLAVEYNLDQWISKGSLMHEQIFGTGAKIKVDLDDFRKRWDKMLDVMAEQEVQRYMPDATRMKEIEAYADAELLDRMSLEAIEARDPADIEAFERNALPSTRGEELDVDDIAKWRQNSDDEIALMQFSQAVKAANDADAAAYEARLFQFGQRLAHIRGFAENMVQAQAQQLKDELARYGLPEMNNLALTDVDLAQMLQALPSAPGRDRLYDRLIKIRDRYVRQLKFVELWESNLITHADLEAQAPALAELYDYHLRKQNGRPVDAISRMREDIQTSANADLIGEINAGRWIQRLIRRMSEGPDGLNQVYSELDGHFRPGVTTPGDNIPTRIKARQSEYLTTFHLVLHRTGLMELFRNDRNLPYEQRLLPKVFAAMLGDKRVLAEPEIGPKIGEIAKVMQEINTGIAGELNRNGAHIRLLDNYLFSAVHNAHRIKAVGFDAWAAFLHEHLDWARTAQETGIQNTAQAKANYLKSLFHELTSKDELKPKNFDQVVRLGNTGEAVSRRRTLHFKGTKAYDYDMAFGSGNTAGHIVSTWGRDLHQAVLMETFGNRFRKTFDEAMVYLGTEKDPDMKFERNHKTLSIARMAKSALLSGVGYGKQRRIRATFDHLVGDLNTPVNHSTALYGQAIRKYAHSAFGWTSGISSLTDIGNILSVLRHFGGLDGFRHEVMYGRSLKQAAASEQGRMWMVGQGAGLQAFLSAMGKVMVSDSGIYRFSDFASDVTFKYSGQEMWTRTAQIAMNDVIQQGLAKADPDRLSAADWAEFQLWLDHHGITRSQWVNDILPTAQEVPGLPGKRIAPDLVDDPNLREALFVAMHDTISYGVFEPSESTRAHLTFLTKAGTPLGEAVRVINQYKSYPLGVSTKQQARFHYGYEGPRSSIPERIVWISMMLSAAAGVLAIKDVLRGNEPFNPFDTDQWSHAMLVRWLGQAGTGWMAVTDQLFSVQGAAGPLPGALLSLGKAARSDNNYQKVNRSLALLPGSTIGPLNQFQRWTIAQFSDGYAAKRDLAQISTANMTGQGRIFKLD